MEGELVTLSIREYHRHEKKVNNINHYVFSTKTLISLSILILSHSKGPLPSAGTKFSHKRNYDGNILLTLSDGITDPNIDPVANYMFQ